MASWLWSIISCLFFPVSIIMSSDDESTSKIIPPILEDQEDNDVSLDPSIHDSVPDGPDDDADMSDNHWLVCELCGAADVDLAEWGDDCWVCIACLSCALCGANESELVERDGGYICILCNEVFYFGAVSDDEDVPSNNEASDADATSHHADPAREQAAAQQLACNPINSDPEATQWGVSSHSESGPTDFGSLVED